MTGFKSKTSGIGSAHISNWATTTSHFYLIVCFGLKCFSGTSRPDCSILKVFLKYLATFWAILSFLGYFELLGLFWEISANYCNIFCVIWWFWGQIWEVLITANFCMFDLGYLMILYLKISDNVSSYFAIFRVYLVFEKYLEPTLAYFGCCKRPNIEHII